MTFFTPPFFRTFPSFLIELRIYHPKKICWTFMKTFPERLEWRVEHLDFYKEDLLVLAAASGPSFRLGGAIIGEINCQPSLEAFHRSSRSSRGSSYLPKRFSLFRVFSRIYYLLNHLFNTIICDNFSLHLMDKWTKIMAKGIKQSW